MRGGVAVAAGWGKGGAWRRGCGDRIDPSDEESFWSWPKKSAGKVFRRRRVLAGDGGSSPEKVTGNRRGREM
ncbi:hypothetical protein Tco_1553695 [Tanacetum coccineum]